MSTPKCVIFKGSKDLVKLRSTVLKGTQMIQGILLPSRQLEAELSWVSLDNVYAELKQHCGLVHNYKNVKKNANSSRFKSDLKL